jgi:hypothetical protein
MGDLTDMTPFEKKDILGDMVENYGHLHSHYAVEYALGLGKIDQSQAKDFHVLIDKAQKRI